MLLTTVTDTLHKKGKPHKVIAEKDSCSQSAVMKNITDSWLEG